MHLYSMEIRETGVEGVGRPTCWNLLKGSALKANGRMTEDLAASQPPIELGNFGFIPRAPSL